VIAKIDTTAFASVMVVLYVVMMTIQLSNSSSMHSNGPYLPRVLYPVGMPNALAEDAATITVRRDGAIYFGSDQFAPDQLPAALRKRFGSRAERKAYIRADARARYKCVAGVLNAVSAAGVQQVAFLVEKRQI